MPYLKNQKRIHLSSLYALMMGLGGIIILGGNIELTGSLFLIISFCTIIYTLLSHFYLKNKSTYYIDQLYLNQVKTFTFLLGFLCLIGAIESAPLYIDVTIVFSVIMLSLFGITQFYFRNNTLSSLFLALYAGLGVVLIRLDDSYGDKEEFTIAAFFYFIVLLLIVVKWLFKQIKYTINLKNEKKKTELMHLQSQVNPHFFFNMLNNLYGLVEIDIKKSQEIILKLSDLMRYGIYEGQQDLVTLDKEINYIKNYIDLHKLRYKKEINITFKIDIKDFNFKLLPLLLIILVENAFKHGVEKLREGAYVDISIISDESKIKLNVKNNFDTSLELGSSGIGLKNLQRRLELVYPNKHILAYSVTEDIYQVELTLHKL